MADSLIPVAFHGATLMAVLVNGIPHVSIRSLCEALGLDWAGQLQRIKRHPALAAVVGVTPTTADDGKQYDTITIPLDKLNGWLFGVSAARVRPELRERLVQYQRECFDVLAAHFGAAAAAPHPVVVAAQPTPGQRWLLQAGPGGRMETTPLAADVQIISPAELAERAHQARVAELRKALAKHEKEAQDHRNSMPMYAKFTRPRDRCNWLSHIARAATADWYAEDVRAQLCALGVDVLAALPAPTPAAPGDPA